MNDDTHRLIERFKTEKEKTIEFFRKIPQQSLKTKLYSDGEEWDIYQILIHIVQVEDGIRRLVLNILQGGEGVPKDFRMDEYNERKVRELEEVSLDALLDLFSVRRDLTIQTIEEITPGDFNKKGRHPYLGEAPVLEMLKLMYRHVQLHQRDIKRFIKT